MCKVLTSSGIDSLSSFVNSAIFFPSFNLAIIFSLGNFFCITRSKAPRSAQVNPAATLFSESARLVGINPSPAVTNPKPNSIKDLIGRFLTLLAPYKYTPVPNPFTASFEIESVPHIGASSATRIASVAAKLKGSLNQLSFKTGTLEVTSIEGMY